MNGNEHETINTICLNDGKIHTLTKEWTISEEKRAKDTLKFCDDRGVNYLGICAYCGCAIPESMADKSQYLVNIIYGKVIAEIYHNHCL